MFSFDKTKVNTHKPIGRGGYGAIFEYKSSENDNRWVVKVLETKKIPDFLEHIQEIVLGFSLDHPNVISIKGYQIEMKVLDKDEIGFLTYMKLPRMQCSLKDKISSRQISRKHFPENQLARYFYDLVCGLEYIHKRKIAHRDINTNNILVDYDDRLKIADVGIAKFIGDESSKVINEVGGTRGYIAPELFVDPHLKNRNLFKADIWSLGLVMLELCLLEPNFNKEPDNFEEKLAKALSKLREKVYSYELIELISNLLQKDPEERISLSEVKRTLEEKYSCFLKDSPRWKEMIKEVRKDMKLKHGDLFTFREETYEEQIGIQIEPKDCSKIGDEQIKNLLDHFTEALNKRNLKELEVFSFNIQDCEKITDDAVIELSTEIGKNLTRLKYLALEFKNCPNVTDEGIDILSQQFGANLKELEALFFYLSNSQNITDKGASRLVARIASNFKQLKRLGLDFGNCNITDFTIGELVEYLPKNLQNLKKLYLYFSCSNITEKSFLSLISTVQNLKDIEAFDLDLVGCNISNDTINQLTKSIQKGYKNLKSLTLYFGGCNKITNEPVLQLVNQISFKKLHSFKMGLCGCTYINKETVIEICKTIGRSSKKLHTLKLWFDHAIYEDETKAFLEKSLKYIPDLAIKFS